MPGTDDCPMRRCGDAWRHSGTERLELALCGSTGRRRPPEPGPPLAQQLSELGAAQAGQALAAHLIADPRLQVRKMPIPRRKAHEELPIQARQLTGNHGVEAILLVDRLPPHHAPAAGSPFEKVVEAPGADDVAQYTVDQRPLVDRHLRLCNGSIRRDIAGETSEEMQDIDAALEALAASANELPRRRL